MEKIFIPFSWSTRSVSLFSLPFRCSLVSFTEILQFILNRISSFLPRRRKKADRNSVIQHDHSENAHILYNYVVGGGIFMENDESPLDISSLMIDY